MNPVVVAVSVSDKSWNGCRSMEEKEGGEGGWSRPRARSLSLLYLCLVIAFLLPLRPRLPLVVFLASCVPNYPTTHTPTRPTAPLCVLPHPLSLRKPSPSLTLHLFCSISLLLVSTPVALGRVVPSSAPRRFDSFLFAYNSSPCFFHSSASPRTNAVLRPSPTPRVHL